MQTGTKWLKALCYYIMKHQASGHDNKNEEEEDDDLLETKIYSENLQSNLSSMLSPKLFHTMMTCLSIILTPESFDPFWPTYPMEKALDSFCCKVHFFGIKSPNKILFLRYKENEVDKVLWRCSLERLKNLDVNKNGESLCPYVPNNTCFRVGVIGDWKNYLTPYMA
ncbi:hypothetical protein K2173_024121 [Erythroxylum novogranatense]|uniref:Sulfotransferase n=1 Tax=Erythroxylum novogranatense TaxID=1862640 RepID=A0AAV8UD98_9ROSI|nr:hypothetical protein K2173_024121 [Erythroxylum novogranatense]